MVRPTLSVVPEQDDVGPARRRAVPTHRPDPGLLLGPLALGAVLGDTEWTRRAVCTVTDPDALFVTGAAQHDAVKICQACPVRLECLADALDNQIEYGVWGGMTERQRRAVLKKSPEVTSWRAVLEEARSASTQDAAS